MGSSASKPKFDTANRSYQMALGLHLAASGSAELPKALPPLAIACHALLGPDLHSVSSVEDRRTIRKALTKSDFFSVFQNPRILDEIVLWFRPIIVPFGETILHPGQLATSAFMIDSGECDVMRKGCCVPTLQCHSFFEEYGLLSFSFSRRHAVTVVAGSSAWKGKDVRLFAISRARFWRALTRGSSSASSDSYAHEVVKRTGARRPPTAAELQRAEAMPTEEGPYLEN